MLEFIKESLKDKNLYVSTNILNKVTAEIENAIIENKKEFERALKIDLETSKGRISINKIIEILDMYKGSEISENTKKDIDSCIYYR